MVDLHSHRKCPILLSDWNLDLILGKKKLKASKHLQSASKYDNVLPIKENTVACIINIFWRS